MHIDWFTFAAQIFNFLVLVALLRWLLYGPIVRTMNQREEKIADRMNEADEKRAEADERAERYETKTREFEQQRETLRKEARHEADEERKRLLAEAREEVDSQRDEWLDAYDQQRDDLLADLRRQAGQMGVKTARQTLSELADTELERQMFRAFISRIQQLDDDQRKAIQHELDAHDGDVVVRSGCDAPNEEQKRIGQAIRETLGYEGNIAFETSSDLVCGVELDVAGYCLGWNVREFLRDMELDLDERWDAKHTE